MDDMQRETPVSPASGTPGEGEVRAATPTAPAPGRMLANPRRVRLA